MASWRKVKLDTTKGNFLRKLWLHWEHDEELAIKGRPSISNHFWGGGEEVQSIGESTTTCIKGLPLIYTYMTPLKKRENTHLKEITLLKGLIIGDFSFFPRRKVSFFSLFRFLMIVDVIFCFLMVHFCFWFKRNFRPF